MSLPLVISLAAQGPLDTVRIADVDGDGRREVVLASVSGPPQARATFLEVVALLPSGQEQRRSFEDLGTRAAWWDAGHGLWLADATGLLELQRDRRIVTRETALPSRANTRPTWAPMVRDLNHDGQAELFLRTRDELLVASPRGTLYGTLPATPRTELDVVSQLGGEALRTTLVSPPVATADMDGDGVDDVLVVGPDRLYIHRAAAGAVVATPQLMDLPRALLEPGGLDAAGVGAETTAVHWADLTGDGRADLLVHRLHSSGKLTGTRSELQLYANRGKSLGPPQAVDTGAISREAYLVDFDADGDLDVLLPQLRVDAGSLAQAVFDRTVDMQLTLVPAEEGGLGEPRKLGDLALPIEGSATGWSLFEDLDGDGFVDLAIAVDGRLRVFPGDGQRIASRPTVDLDLGLAVSNLWAADLTGDGAAELLGWTPGVDRAVVVKLR